MRLGTQDIDLGRGNPRIAIWIGLAAGCIVLGSAARPCLAQRSRSYRPSDSGPSRQMLENFGRVGGWLGGGPSSTYRPPAPAPSTDLSNPMRQRRDPRFYRRPGMGQGGMDLGYGLGAVQGAPLLIPGRANPLSWSRSTPGTPRPVYGALSRAYDQTLQSQIGMTDILGAREKSFSRDYLTWVPSETGPVDVTATGVGAGVLAQPVVADQPGAAPQGLEEPKQSLEELVRNHVTALRRSYMDRGWNAFSQGEYQDALRMFSLADHASLDEPQERANVKLAMVYVAISANQYSQAVNALDWVLNDRGAVGRVGHPEAFNRVFADRGGSTMGDLYVRPDGTRDTAEYQRHNLLVESTLTRNPDSPQLRALAAVVEWGRGRRSNAIFEARKINDPTNRLTGLASVMEQADRLGQPLPGAGSPGATPERLAAPPTSQPGQ